MFLEASIRVSDIFLCPRKAHSRCSFGFVTGGSEAGETGAVHVGEQQPESINHDCWLSHPAESEKVIEIFGTKIQSNWDIIANGQVNHHSISRIVELSILKSHDI